QHGRDRRRVKPERDGTGESRNRNERETGGIEFHWWSGGQLGCRGPRRQGLMRAGRMEIQADRHPPSEKLRRWRRRLTAEGLNPIFEREFAFFQKGFFVLLLLGQVGES